MRLIKVGVLQQVDCVIEIALLVRHPAGHVWGYGGTCKRWEPNFSLASITDFGSVWWWLEMTYDAGGLIGWIFVLYP